MNISNIGLIIKSDLWKEIIDRPEFLTFKIVKPKGNSYQFYSLWIFFDRTVSEQALRGFFNEGYSLVRTECLERDYSSIFINSYLKVLVFC